MPDEPSARRLFFAIWPDEASRAALVHATRKAARASGGRPVSVSNLHSTLAFLGSVPAERMTSAIAAASAVESLSFGLAFDRIEHWPKPAVLCLTCSEVPPAASGLVSELWKLLARQGFTPDSKPYRPHITIARKVVKPHALGTVQAVECPVEEIVLVESITAPEGAQYTVLQRWPLQK